MPPLVFPAAPRSQRMPVVLPRGCEGLVKLRADGWPVRLVIPQDCGLMDPSCAYWHGLAAANGAGPLGQVGA